MDKTAVKLKRCKVCKEQYKPYSSLSQACSVPCSLALVEEKKRKKIKKDVREYRIATKNISVWLAEAQTSINSYVRIRDHDKSCISCSCSKDGDYLTGSKFDSGHYRSRGSAPHLRFNLNNIFKQCVRCNRELSGNTVEMRKGIIERIGIEKLEALEANNNYRKFSREYCERVKRIFNKKTRIQKKRLGIS